MPNTVSTPYTAEVAYRGIRKTFTFGFFEDDLQTVPIVPFDVNYPMIQIIQPDGQIFLTRKPPSVRPSGTPGFWAFDFDVPSDAQVTAINEAWEFAAVITDASGRENTYRTTFIVKDPNVVKSGNQSRFYPVVNGREVRLIFRSPVPLDNVSLDVLISGTEDGYVVQGASVGNTPFVDIIRVVSEGIYTYYFDVRAQKTTGMTLRDLTTGIYQAHWSIRETPTSMNDLVYQIIQVFHNSILEYVPHVRYIVDKLEKRFSIRQGYDESDVLGALDMGIQLVNTTFPATNFSLTPGGGGIAFGNSNGGVVPAQLKPYIVLAAAWWLYMGQLGLSVDLQFSFSGQRTVLDQDQTGGIEGLLDKYRTQLRDDLKDVKTDLLRQARRTGIVATRPARARYLYNTVFRVDALNSGSVIGFLNSIGLI